MLLEFELELLLELLLEFELEFELELLLELELEFELELLLEFELEFELELLLEFELEFELELLLEFPPSPSSLLVRLLRNWVPLPALGGAARSTPGPTARLKKLNGPSSAAAGNAMAPVDSRAAANVFLRRISIPRSWPALPVGGARPSLGYLGSLPAVSKPGGRFSPNPNLALAEL